uniref:Uncharacterized protein n=1 Tax=Aegilops tauschii subsp. strangulata TaxID=200361 RepID=A0A452ZJN8_AEGTS
TTRGEQLLPTLSIPSHSFLYPHSRRVRTSPPLRPPARPLATATATSSHRRPPPPRHHYIYVRAMNAFLTPHLPLVHHHSSSSHQQCATVTIVVACTALLVRFRD